MPFGKWDSFDDCKTDMMGPPNNYDEETAKKVCGKIQSRLEGKELFRILKSKSGRRVIAQYVHVEGLDKQHDIIPLNRTREALEELKNRDPRYQNVMWSHSGYQIGHPLWRFTDEDGDVHKTEVDEYGLWGITEIRNDGFLKADELWDKIMRGEPMGASIAVNPSGKHVVLTKDELIKRKLPNHYLGGRYWDVPLFFIEPWSLTQHPANQYVTAAVVLAKEICEPCVEARAQWYIRKGLFTQEQYTEALERAREFYVNYQKLQEQTIKQTEKLSVAKEVSRDAQFAMLMELEKTKRKS